MRTYIRCATRLAALLALVGFISPAQANLCKEKHVKSRHEDAGKRVKNENFGQGSYAGSEDYNGHVIACNRRRDTQGKDIEKKIKSNHSFAENLSPRLIKGKIKYLGKWPVRYGYGLERKNGTWILTAPLDFHWPTLYPNRLDIPMDLARELGIDKSDCSTTTKKLGHIDLGFVDTFKKKHKKEMRENGWTEEQITTRIQKVGACRLKRNMKVNGTPIKTHVMRFWKREIQDYWSRPGFQVKTPIIDLNELSKSAKKGYEKGKAVWPIRFNHLRYSRATYKAIIGKPHPLYAGLPHDTIVHEFGHWLGLDDEYPESEKRHLKCSDLGGSSYVMCSSPVGVQPIAAKGVYAWITTRRYAVGTDMPIACSKDSQCKSSQYCYTGVGRDVCKDKKKNGKTCLKSKVCQSGRCAGGFCAKADECTKDSQCKSSQYCDTGVGRNKCKSKRANGKGCTKSRYCSSGRCLRLFCRSKSFCSKEKDCSRGKYCDKGKLGASDNKCRSEKSKGKSCKKNKECKSNKCKRKKCK